jgi:hypothetical protein
VTCADATTTLPEETMLFTFARLAGARLIWHGHNVVADLVCRLAEHELGKDHR